MRAYWVFQFAVFALLCGALALNAWVSLVEVWPIMRVGLTGSFVVVGLWALWMALVALFASYREDDK